MSVWPCASRKTKAGQQAARFGVIIVHRIERVRANCAARGSGRDFVDAVKPRDFLDQVHLPLQINAERRHANRAGAAALGGDFEAAGCANAGRSRQPGISTPSNAVVFAWRNVISFGAGGAG